MRKWMFTGLLVCTQPFSCSALHAQAFGVIMGDPVSKYGGHPVNGNKIYLIKVPKPNSEFEQYLAKATLETGICSVSALGKTHESDAYGAEVRSVFARIKNSLSEKYGESQDFDFLKAGALWDEPNYYGWSLYKKERVLSSFWNRSESSANFGDIKAIMLDSAALKPDKLYVTLSYEFINIDRCNAIINGKDNDGL